MFEEDLSVFFQEFGYQALLNGQSIRGILNFHPHQTESFNLLEVTFVTTEAEMITVNLGDIILIGSQSYQIMEKIPDGLGLMQLKLGRSYT